ncbi:MAG: hemolysin family protein [Syntrophomonadaceae bacterium]|nr:hemolysin family protein [Syntrophomonadaceae bacterium]
MILEQAFSLQIIMSIIKIMAALLLVLLNGFFVAAEFALVRVRPTRITQLAEGGNKRALIARECIENLDAYLSVSQLGITLSSLGLGWLGEPAVAALLEPLLSSWGISSPALVKSISFIIAFSLITFLHVVFGELAPKSLAIQKAESISLALARPMRTFFFLFYPAVAILNGTALTIVHLLGFKTTRETDITHTGEELRMLISESYRGGQIDETEQELLQNVFRFEERVAEEIMVPRPEVVFLDINDSLEENIARARRFEHTRFPLCDGSPDQVIGLIHIKDLVYKGDDCHNINEIKRDILFVPEGMPLDNLLSAFQKSRKHMAVILDEYGGTAGIVTMENVLEELVGEIQDEFDQEEPEIKEEPDGTFLVSGMLFIDDATEIFSLPLDDEEQYNTLAGYILGKLGKRPREGDTVTINDIKLKVEKMDGMRIARIRLYPPEKKSGNRTKKSSDNQK